MNLTCLLTSLVTLSLSLVQAQATAPPWFPAAPPLPSPQGAVVHVATDNELLDAVDNVRPGGTILIADGEYRVSRPIVLRGKRDITLRGATDDPTKVILSGKGWNSMAPGDDILRIGRCDGVTIANLTFTDCHSYGIKIEAENAPRNIQIYNCHFRNIGTRAIKGSANQDQESRAVRGSIRFCHFQNDKMPPATWLFDGDYIAAIDMMALDDWTISDNTFRNIRGRNGGGRAAIFLWVRSQNIIVERNLITGCDRGISFGNPGQSTAQFPGKPPLHVSNGIIRNNFIAGGSDCGIELWHVQDLLVAHNSIWRPNQHWQRGIRVGSGTVRIDIVNNLVHGGILLDGGTAQLRHNFAGLLDDYFADPTEGDLILTTNAIGAFGQGITLSQVPADIRRLPRSSNPTLGAWEGPSASHPD